MDHTSRFKIWLFFVPDYCRQIQFKEQMENKVLRNHVIKRSQDVGIDGCELQCYLEPNCVSYNYGPSLCELNDITHLQAPSNDMETRDGCIYRAVFRVSLILLNIFHLEISSDYDYDYDYLLLLLLFISLILFFYFFFQKPCLSSPCFNGATCQTGFSEQGYRCVCITGYHGNKCELGKTSCFCLHM